MRRRWPPPCVLSPSPLDDGLVRLVEDVRLARVELSLHALDDVVPRGGAHHTLERRDVDAEPVSDVEPTLPHRQPRRQAPPPLKITINRWVGPIHRDAQRFDNDGLLSVLQHYAS